MTPTTPAVSDEGLLPCPFCGATDMWTGFMGGDDGGYGYVECRKSCAQAHEDDEDAARKAWNTRATRHPVKGDSVELVERVAAWLRQCSSWLLENDLDMTCPMEADPLDLADGLEALASGHTALSERVVVLEGVLKRIAESDIYEFGGDDLRDMATAALKGCDALGGGE